MRARLRPLAGGLTPRAVLDKFAAVQMLDVHFPTTDGRVLILSRYTHPELDQKIRLERLGMNWPAADHRRRSIAALKRSRTRRPHVVEAFGIVRRFTTTYASSPLQLRKSG